MTKPPRGCRGALLPVLVLLAAALVAVMSWTPEVGATGSAPGEGQASAAAPSDAGATGAPPSYTGWSQWEGFLPPGLGGSPGGPPPAAPPPSVTPPGSSSGRPVGTTAPGAPVRSTAPVLGAPRPALASSPALGLTLPAAQVLPAAEVLGETVTAPAAPAPFAAGPPARPGGGAPPAAPAPTEARSTVSSGVPDRIDLSPVRVLTNVGLGALLTLVLVASSQLFNDALKMHHDRLVTGAAGRLGIVRWASAAAALLPRPPIVVSFALVAGALGLLADPTVSLNATTLGQMLGMGVAVGLIVAIYDGTASRAIARRSGLSHSYRLYPVAIAVALGCLLLSRLFDVAPGVLYGLFAGVIFTGAVDSRLEGRVFARSSVLLVGAAMAAWVVHRQVGLTPDDSPGLLVIAVDTAAAALFVGGLQAVIVQLLPTRYVNGEKIAAWNRWAWIGLLVGTMAIYLQFVVRPNPDAQTWSNLWFVGAFVVAAVCVWAVLALQRWSDERDGDGDADDRPDAEMAGGMV